MKRILIIMLLLAAVPGISVSAQKWLKNVGKALEKVDKFLDTSSSSSSSTTSSRSQSSASQKVKGRETKIGDVTLNNAITGIDVTYMGAYRTDADKGIIDLKFLNSGSEDITVYGLRQQVAIFDTEGNQYDDFTVLTGNDHTNWGGYRFRAGIPARVKLEIHGLPAGQEVTIHTAKFPASLKYDSSVANPLEIKNVVIPVYDKTIADAAAKGFPEKGQWTAVTPDGDNIIIDFNSKSKEFMFAGESNYGFILADPKLGSKQMNTIEEVKINGTSAIMTFLNFRDYNVYTIKVTYNPADGTLTTSDLNTIEFGSEIPKRSLIFPDDPQKFSHASIPVNYSLDDYQ